MNRLPQRERLTLRVVAKYTLLQLPSLLLVGLILILLHQWAGLSAALAWGIFGLWVVKDLALFPVLWRSYAETPASGNTLAGERGVAVDVLSPRGYVRVRGELWRAEVVPGHGPVPKGGKVRVLGSEGLTLQVSPVPGEEKSS